MSNAREYVTVVTSDAAGRLVVPVPFDPDESWGPKSRHHITGTVDGVRVRGVVEPLSSGRAFTLGPAWRRDCGVEPGRQVTVVIEAEGPQRANLAPDVAAALEAEPQAGAFFDGLAQFYRKGYLRWVDATKRRPDLRAARIAEMVELLKNSHKERPKR
jgi:hypothetical protein